MTRPQIVKSLAFLALLGTVATFMLRGETVAQTSTRIPIYGVVTIDGKPAANITVVRKRTSSTTYYNCSVSASDGSFVCNVYTPWSGIITASASNVTFNTVTLTNVTSTPPRITVAGTTQSTAPAPSPTPSPTPAPSPSPTPSPTPTGGYPWPVWTSAIPAVPPSTVGNTYYVDKAHGSDSNNGLSHTAAFATVAKAVSLVQPGDTVLIGAGLYREGINLNNRPSGVSGKPITFGSYGDGEVILDGSKKVGPWTVYSGTVWKAPVSFTPIGVVVNEVPLKQVPQGQGGSTAPQVGLSGVTSGSGKWYVGGGYIYADMGTTIGSGDPNNADIVVPNNVGDQQHVYFYGDYYVFKGLTIRGSGSNGIWGYGSHVTVESCNIKFNGKSAVSFMVDSSQPQTSDDAVLTSHIYHNVLLNWPRGNNGYAESGGGWPGTLVWSTILRPVARGNIVHMNGGEGIISYGTMAGHPSGYALFEQNVVYDNWSVNMYFDNQAYDVARNNFIFNHPVDNGNFLYVGSYPYNNLGKYTVCLMLADEENSSDATNNYANLNHTSVYNNILAGCRIGIRDYSEGSHAYAYHGLKNTLIANNTIIMPYAPIANASTFGIYLLDNITPSGTNRNTNTLIENNIVYGFNNDPVVFSEYTGALPGITLNYNDYYSASANPFGSGTNTIKYYNFSGWKSAMTGLDANSKFQDPLLVDVTQFRAAGTSPYDYNKAALVSGSPATGAGTAMSAFANNFTGATRSGWNIGAY